MAANVELKERNNSITALDTFKAKIKENAELNKLQDELIQIQTTFFKKKVSEEVKNEFLKKLQEITDLLFKQFAQTESNKGKIRKESINKLLQNVVIKYKDDVSDFGKMVYDKISNLIKYIEKVEKITSEEEEIIRNVVDNLMKNNAGKNYTPNEKAIKNQELKNIKESLEKAKVEVNSKNQSITQLTNEKKELTKKRVYNLKAATNMTKNLLIKGYTKAELKKYSNELEKITKDINNNNKIDLKKQIDNLMKAKNESVEKIKTDLQSKNKNKKIRPMDLSLIELANIMPDIYKNDYTDKEKTILREFNLMGKRNREYVKTLKEIEELYNEIKKKNKKKSPSDIYSEILANEKYKDNDFAKKIVLYFLYTKQSGWSMFT